MAVANVPPQETGRPAVPGHRSHVLGQRAVGGKRQRIGDHRAFGLAQAELDVVVVEAVRRPQQSAHAFAFFHDQVQRRIEGRGVAHPADVREGLSHQVGVLLAVQQRDGVPAFVRDEQPHVLGIALHPFPGAGVLQPFEDPGRAALLGPWRQDRLDQRMAPVVRDDVEGDVDALAADRLDHLQAVFHGVGGGAVLRLDVRDLQARRSVARGAQGLAEAEVVVCVAIAHVGRIQPVPAGRDLAQRDDVLRCADVPRPVLQPGREAVRALVEGFVEQIGHAPRLFDGRRAKLVAHHRPVHRAVPDERRHVHARPARVEALQVLAEALPAHVHLAVVGVSDGAVPGVPGTGDGRAAMAALADDLGGDPLVDLALRPPVDQQREVGVGMQVDESGADGKPVQLDALRRFLPRQVADARDPAVADADVGPERRAAGPVEDLPAGKCQVDHDGPLPGNAALRPPGRRPGGRTRRSLMRSPDIRRVRYYAGPQFTPGREDGGGERRPCRAVDGTERVPGRTCP